MSLNKKLVRKEFNESVFDRDGHKCRICGRSVKLDAHHITDRRDMPNGGYVKENGISLCSVPSGDGQASCHEKAELFHVSHGKAWIPGLHPNELYKLIDSSYEKAAEASEALK